METMHSNTFWELYAYLPPKRMSVSLKNGVGFRASAAAATNADAF